MHISDRPIPMHKWGKDHWTTIVYAETCVVDNNGVLNNRKLRVDPRIHEQHAHVARSIDCPTRLKWHTEEDPIVEVFHDDISCLEDAERAGILILESSILYVELTDFGWFVCGKLRRYRSERQPYDQYYNMLTESINNEHDCIWAYKEAE